VKLDLFLQKSSNLYAENRLLKFVVVIIGIVTIVNTYTVTKALNTHTTILVPPVIKSRIEISGDKADEKYIKTFTRYITGLLLNYSPSTARSQFDELLALYAPRAYDAAKSEFYDMAESVEATGSNSIFYINAISVSEEESRIHVDGLLRRYIEDLKITDEVKTYFIRYRISNGRFMLEKVTEGVLDK